MSIAVTALLALAACQDPATSQAPQVNLRPSTIDLPEARYDVPPQFDSFLITNVGADTVYLSLDTTQGDGGELVELSILPFTTLSPEQTRAIEITLDPMIWRWSTGSWSTTVQVDARYFFSGQAKDEPETPSFDTPPEPVASAFELTVNYSINCDLDGDGIDSVACAPTCTGDGTEANPRICDPGDCRDDLPETFPGADELCNGRDDDCDGGIDEDAVDLQTWYPDADGDGYGDDEGGVDTCTRPAGRWTLFDGDCDDTRGIVNPDVPELCGDGEDNDCDGFVDETCA